MNAKFYAFISSFLLLSGFALPRCSEDFCNDPTPDMLGKSYTVTVSSYNKNATNVILQGNCHGSSWESNVESGSGNTVEAECVLSEDQFVCFDAKIETEDGAVWLVQDDGEGGYSLNGDIQFKLEGRIPLCWSIEEDCGGGGNVCLFYNGACD